MSYNIPGPMSKAVLSKGQRLARGGNSYCEEVKTAERVLIPAAKLNKW